MLEMRNKRKKRKDEKDKCSRYQCELSQKRGNMCFEADVNRKEGNVK